MSLRTRLSALRNWLTFTPLRFLATVLAAAVVLAGAGYGVYTLVAPAPRPAPDLSCGSPGVHHPEAGSPACVGVTDGSYDFSAFLKPVDRLIKQQNDHLGKGAVTVALLMPLTSSDPTVRNEIKESVQGALVAQVQANTSGENPPVRLVLANAGEGPDDWRQVAAQLLQMTQAPDNLRAAVGIEDSTDASRDEVSWLTAHHIPVVGGPITGDKLANPDSGQQQPFPGLARVAPTNSEEAQALQHISGIDPARTILVEDTNSSDKYTSSLESAFAAEARHATYQPPTFSSPPDVNAEGDTQDRFNTITGTICTHGPQTILFAGRHVQLRQFLNELGSNCGGTDFTVVTGDDATHLTADPRLQLNLLQHITVEYPGLASPAPWSLPADSRYAAGFQAFQAAAAQAFPKDGQPALDDGEALIAHDAVWTAFRALVVWKGQSNAKAAQTPGLGDVAQTWSLLVANNTVQGASGWICLNNSGNPWDKAVAIMKLTANGVSFQQLAWPQGTPPGSLYQCEAPPSP